jgi:hypothetical protein
LVEDGYVCLMLVVVALSAAEAADAPLMLVVVALSAPLPPSARLVTSAVA